jgi:hypothetical protein
VTAFLPNTLGKRLRVFIAHQGSTISEVVEAALNEYLDKRMVQAAIPVPQLETLADLVKINHFELMNLGKINPDRLNELAFGQKPTTAELAIIANVLGVAEEFVVALRDRSFPKSSKPKQKNGTP